MKSPFILLLAMTCAGVAAAGSLAVRNNAGAAYVRADSLEREYGIVIKRLGSSTHYVACGTNLCVRLNALAQDGELLLVPVSELTETMRLTAVFSPDRSLVDLVFPRNQSVESNSSAAAQLGSIIPNLRFVRADGSAILLEEFRGQRVLINSWASW